MLHGLDVGGEAGETQVQLVANRETLGELVSYHQGLGT